MKSKLFLSLSLLTVVVSISALDTPAQVRIFNRKTQTWSPYQPSRPTINPVTPTITAAVATPVVTAAVTPTVATAAAVATPTVATTSKIAPVLAHPTTQFTALAAGTLVVGTAVAGATVYGAQKAYGYMYPKQEVKLTRFESAKLALNNGYTTVKTNAMSGYKSSLTFVKANPKSTAGAVAAVAALGLVAYKYSDSIFGKSKAEAAPEAPKAPVRVAHVRALRD